MKISQSLRATCKEKGLSLKYTQAKDFHSRSNLLIQHEISKEKAHLDILVAYLEMDVVYSAKDNATNTLEFKDDVLFVLDQIAKETHSESIRLGMSADEKYLSERGYVHISSLPQYDEWAAIFHGYTMNPDYPIYAYSDNPFQYRINIWNEVNILLRKSKISSEYSMGMDIAELSIQRKNASLKKQLVIHHDGVNFHIKCGLDENTVVASSDEEMLAFISKAAI